MSTQYQTIFDGFMQPKEFARETGISLRKTYRMMTVGDLVTIDISGKKHIAVVASKARFQKRAEEAASGTADAPRRRGRPNHSSE